MQHSQQSYFKTYYSIVQCKDINPVQKLIYFHLLSLSTAPASRKVGGTFQSNAEIASCLGITTRQAKENVEKLQHIGILVSFKVKGQRVLRVIDENDFLKTIEKYHRQKTVSHTENCLPIDKKLSTHKQKTVCTIDRKLSRYNNSYKIN